MVWERMSVGLDVHARSVVAGVIDGHTGELWSERLAPTSELVVAWVLAWVVAWVLAWVVAWVVAWVLAWVLGLPGPVGVAYEAGPTGFGLARALAAVGCGVWWWPLPSWQAGAATRRSGQDRPAGCGAAG
jgi:transposase